MVESKSIVVGLLKDGVVYGPAHEQLISRILDKAVAQIQAQRTVPAAEVKPVDIARHLQLNPSVITRWVKDGRIPHLGTIETRLYDRLKLDARELDELRDLHPKAVQERRNPHGEGAADGRRSRA